MGMLNIMMDAGRTHFEPGDTIEGEVQWEYAEPPDSIDVRLFWYTEGRGTQDVNVEEEVVIEYPSRNDSKLFSFRAPSDPYSFDGTLISLKWAIEAVGAKGMTERVEIVIAPGCREVKI